MRRKITDVEDLADELPDLTEQQMRFVEGILAGKTASDAYRAAYDCSGSRPGTVWANASRLRSNNNVALWLSAARKAGLGQSTVTLASHIQELERLREVALESGNVGAAVQAEQLRGKAMGHYTERVEITDLTDAETELREIAKISPELAQAYAREKGIPFH